MQHWFRQGCFYFCKAVGTTAEEAQTNAALVARREEQREPMTTAAHPEARKSKLAPKSSHSR
jgi:hypothetical protein